MALPNTFSANTKAKSSEVNANFIYVDYTLIDNNKAVAWTNGTSIKENTSNQLESRAGNDVHRIASADGSKYLQVSLSGTNANLSSSSGLVRFTDNVDITGGKYFRVFDTTGSDWFQVTHNGSNVIYDVNNGEHIFRDTTSDNIILLGASYIRTYRDVELYPGNGTRAILYIYDSTPNRYIRIYHDDANTRFIIDSNRELLITSDGNMTLKPDTDGDFVIIGRMPRKDDGTDTYVDSTIVRGWDARLGSGTDTMTFTKIFAVSFDTADFDVVVMPLGSKASAPANPSECVPYSTIFVTISARPTAVNQIEIVVRRTTGTFSTGTYYGVSFICIGPKS